MHSIVLSWFYNIATIRPNQSLEGGKYLGNFVMVFFSQRNTVLHYSGYVTILATLCLHSFITQVKTKLLTYGYLNLHFDMLNVLNSFSTAPEFIGIAFCLKAHDCQAESLAL